MRKDRSRLRRRSRKSDHTGLSIASHCTAQHRARTETAQRTQHVQASCLKTQLHNSHGRSCPGRVTYQRAWHVRLLFARVSRLSCVASASLNTIHPPLLFLALLTAAAAAPAPAAAAPSGGAGSGSASGSGAGLTAESLRAALAAATASSAAASGAAAASSAGAGAGGAGAFDGAALAAALMQAAAAAGLRMPAARLQLVPIPYILESDAVISALRAHPDSVAALLPLLPAGQQTEAHLWDVVSRGRGRLTGWWHGACISTRLTGFFPSAHHAAKS